jgi:hypothetical protein
VLFILIGSTVFSFTFNAADGHIWVEHLFDKLPGGALGFLIVVNLLVFILGMFIDFFEIAFIVIPMLAPVAEKLLPGMFPPGTPVDAVMIWFGVIIAMNLQTSFLTPPFGFALFYLRSVAAKEDYNDRITGATHPGRDHGADLQGLDRLHRAAGDHGAVVVIAWPKLVIDGMDSGQKVDPDKAIDELSVPLPTARACCSARDAGRPACLARLPRRLAHPAMRHPRQAPQARHCAAAEKEEDPMKGLLEAVKDDNARRSRAAPARGAVVDRRAQ